MTRIRTAEQALDYIHSFDDPYLAALRDHGKQTWGLGAIETLLAQIGNPHRAVPVIHVAGTKGKGSTAAFITQILMESGYRVGLYTSPHLEDWRERIQINRRPIGKGKLAALTQALRPFADQVPGLSAFEVDTALAFWHIQREHCDIAVIEVGLGGRLDATNVVSPLLSVITSISLDHMQLLGNTLGQIAAEKAAIIKAGSPSVSAPQSLEALTVIRQRAAEIGSALSVVGTDWPYKDVTLSPLAPEVEWGHHPLRFRLGLAGRFQVENAATALAAVNIVQKSGLTVPDAAMWRGLARTVWPGRFEVIQSHPPVILDGAHNPFSIGKLTESLVEVAEGKPITVVFGCMADKDSSGMLAHLLPVADRLILTRAEVGRAALPADLRNQAAGLNPAGHFDVEENLLKAVEMGMKAAANSGVLCVTGSLSVVGEARPWLKRQVADRERLIENTIKN